MPQYAFRIPATIVLWVTAPTKEHAAELADGWQTHAHEWEICAGGTSKPGYSLVHVPKPTNETGGPSNG